MVDYLHRVADIPASSWQVLVQASPYVLLGFAAAGLLKSFLPEGFIVRHLGRGRVGPIVKASLLGAPLPLCSCGVLPAAADLRKRGAGKGAVAAFLTATPETGVDSVAVTYGMLDPLMAVVRPVAAVVSALAAGFAVSAFTRPDTGNEPRPEAASACSCSDCGCSETPAPKGLWAKFVSGMAYAAGELMRDVGPWLMLGVVLAGAVTALVPQGLIERHLGPGLPAMLAALVLSTPLYICATASTPLAAALAAKGLSPGAALVLLLAGPATNAAALAVAGKILGRRGLAVYLAALVLVSLGLGLATDALYLRLGMSTSRWAAEVLGQTTGPASQAAAVLLLALLALSLVRRPSPKSC